MGKNLFIKTLFSTSKVKKVLKIFQFQATRLIPALEFFLEHLAEVVPVHQLQVELLHFGFIPRHRGLDWFCQLLLECVDLLVLEVDAGLEIPEEFFCSDLEVGKFVFRAFQFALHGFLPLLSHDLFGVDGLELRRQFLDVGYSAADFVDLAVELIIRI